jgi:hypothetical protein
MPCIRAFSFDCRFARRLRGSRKTGRNYLAILQSTK